MPLPRRKDDFLPQVPEELMGAGQGPPQIPYDQSNPPVADAGGGGAPPPQGMPGQPAAAATPLPPEAVQPTLGLAALGAGGGGTDQMSDVDLASAGGDPAALLNDPTLTPDQRQKIQQLLLMAAQGGGM